MASDSRRATETVGIRSVFSGGDRPLRLISGVTYALALIVVALLVGNLASAHAARPLETGVTTVDTAVVEDPLAFERIRESGAKWTRVILFWSEIAPRNEPSSWDPANPGDPNYDWTAYDSMLNRAVEAGLSPLVSIYSAPRWAERCRNEVPGICNPDPKMFADFTEAAVRRYSGQTSDLPRVRYWKAWNEPNLFLFFMPQFRNGRKVSPDLYRTLLNGFAARVKKVDPSNQVIGGGLAPLQRPGGLGPLDFMRRLLCLKGRTSPEPDGACPVKPRFDIWANNPYTTGRPTHESAGPDDVSLGDLPDVRKVLDAAKRYGTVDSARSKVDMWVTEFSWDSNEPDPGGVPMGLLKRWVPEAMYISWKAGASKFFWLSLRDWYRPPDVPFSETVQAGLYFRGATIAADRPKPILGAFEFPFVAFRNSKGLLVWGRTPTSSSGAIRLEYRNGGAWSPLTRVAAGSNGIFSAQVRTGIGRDRKGQVRAVVQSGRAAAAVSYGFPLTRDKDFYQPPFG